MAGRVEDRVIDGKHGFKLVDNGVRNEIKAGMRDDVTPYGSHDAVTTPTSSSTCSSSATWVKARSALYVVATRVEVVMVNVT